jgi:hypothetical protein
MEVKARMKIVCEVCGRTGYLQKLTKNYSRVRHYAGTDNVTKKPRFEYHKQTLEYINRILDDKQEASNQNIDLNDLKNIDLKLNNLGSLFGNASGCSLVWSRTSACHADDPGSNPGNRTINNINSEL